ncbi:MAG: NADH:ubiquinone reductase (Na(+)-transporting) subunit B, partial [Thermoguttaceae bacterium]
MARLRETVQRVTPAFFRSSGVVPGWPNLSPGIAVTQTAPHVRDAFSLERAMRSVLVALVPCIFMAFYNTGYQANVDVAIAGVKTAPGWRGATLDMLAVGYELSSVWAAIMHGALYFLPILVVTVVVGGLWERIFARLRNRPTAEGFMVIAILFSLSLPRTIPLWQVALGISFAIVVGKEIFGGTGRNFLNPVLTGLAFLYVTYPREMIGETAWTVIDAFTEPTYLQLAARKGPEVVTWLGTPWLTTFVGLSPGSIGTTSTLACLVGATYLLYKRIASARIMAGVLFGMVATVLWVNQFGDQANPFVGVSWHWHLTLGSFAFGAVFLATDPVSAAMTNTGRWIYGLLIGFMIVLIRVANTSHPDGVMFAI